MVTTQKPKSVTITIGDRKAGIYKSFVVYAENVEEVERLVKRAIEKR